MFGEFWIENSSFRICSKDWFLRTNLNCFQVFLYAMGKNGNTENNLKTLTLYISAIVLSWKIGQENCFFMFKFPNRIMFVKTIENCFYAMFLQTNCQELSSKMLLKRPQASLPLCPSLPMQNIKLQSKPDFLFFFFIGKEKDLLKRGIKRAIQGIQYLYTHNIMG